MYSKFAEVELSADSRSAFKPRDPVHRLSSLKLCSFGIPQGIPPETSTLALGWASSPPEGPRRLYTRPISVHTASTGINIDSV